MSAGCAANPPRGRRRDAPFTGTAQRVARKRPGPTGTLGGVNSSAATASESPRVLVCDDEPGIVELLDVSLRFQGFDVRTADSSTRAIDVARTFRPDVVVLDVMMPGMDGFDTLTRLRADGCQAPVLYLTAKDAVEDRVRGLTLGGDDYVTKPFSLEEVVARIRVLLRRGQGVPEQESDDTIRFADIELHDDSHEVFKAGELVPLSPTEFQLLRYFMVNAGVVLSKARILDHVWNYDFGGDANVVESYVSYLRRKVDTGPVKYLQTLRGVGYVLREPR